MAEAIFQQMVNDASLSDVIKVDSAGTSSYHVGEGAHRGTRRVLSQHGIRYNGRARQIRASEMSDPRAYIIAMDSSNLVDLRYTYGDHPRLLRLLDFATDTNVRDVPDPYYSRNFEYVYQLVHDGCRGLLAMIREAEGL
jgi:protein-tyrosine phosphatase